MNVAPAITIDLGKVDMPTAPDVGVLLQAIERALLMGGELARGVWIRVAQGLDLHDTGAYIRGIAVDGRVAVVDPEVDLVAGRWAATLTVTNTAPHASIVEDGHAAFHLPSRINWSGPRVKRTKKGTPYLHIPFRHFAFVAPSARADKGTTRKALRSMMPKHVYELAKNRLGHVRPLRVGPILSASGQFLAADRYAQPTQRHMRRLDRSHIGAGITLGAAGTTGARAEGFEERRGERQVGRSRHGPLTNPEWSASKFHGLFKSGGPRHTTYMTVRTITPRSKGWNIPAQVGHGVARRVGQELASGNEFRDVVADAFASALGGR